MQATSIPGQVVSEVLALLLNHHHIQTEDGKLIDSETLKQFSPIHQYTLQDNRIVSAVDQFLNGLGHHLAVLRGQRNQCLPIYRLPNEIFACIFEILVEDRFAKRGTYDIVAGVAQVSSRWRNIALSTARLWTHIENHYSESLVTTSIARSRNLPLHIFIFEAKKVEREEQFLQLMLPHTARWETCKWDSDNFSEHSSHLMQEDIQMPLLRKFEVVCYGDVILLPNAVWQHAPLLQSLDIVPFQLPEGELSFSRLRKIRFRASANSKEMSSERWYSLLVSCPELEDIDALSVAKIFEEPLNPFQVSLPNLKRFRLESFRGAMIGLLLSSISTREDELPSLDIDDLWNDEGNDEDHDDVHLFDMIFPKSSSKGTLIDCIHNVTMISAHYSDDEYALKIQAGTESKPSHLLYQIHIGGEQASVMWRMVVSPNLLPKLKEIDLTGSPLFQDGTFSSTLCQCTSLERLSIRYPDPVGQTSNFFWITQRLSPTYIGVGNISSPCPNLKYLAVLTQSPNFSLLNNLIQIRYGIHTASIPKNKVIPLEELVLSADHPISGWDKEPITEMKEVLDPLGAVVRIVESTDFYRHNWSI